MKIYTNQKCSKTQKTQQAKSIQTAVLK